MATGILAQLTRLPPSNVANLCVMLVTCVVVRKSHNGKLNELGHYTGK